MDLNVDAAHAAAGGGGGTWLPVVDNLTWLTQYVISEPPVFVRYSRGPYDDAMLGHSRDLEADVLLPGWSVTSLTPEPWWPRPEQDWVSRRIYKYAEIARDSERFPWILKGTVIGRGTDHEPLVVDIIPIARLGAEVLAQAAEHYREHFNAGLGPSG
ncbi:hypothetical protein DFR67_104205 [Williamsia limnetica]|uniref:Uncharacterized protein n=1 Tax=Williamsia limnetica TaxID=882452 RepID=A0A318RQC1_WILLI|nr:DUF6098 family protein [Williamsia limnetica]PYE18626.1 hypothetical protein DFR67_104205 [Williamsia limnetica]